MTDDRPLFATLLYIMCTLMGILIHRSVVFVLFWNYTSVNKNNIIYFVNLNSKYHHWSQQKLTELALYLTAGKIWVKVFKNGPSRICGRQSLKNSTVNMEAVLNLPGPWISESCIKIKINLNFYFHTSSWWLKRFYEGL